MAAEQVAGGMVAPPAAPAPVSGGEPVEAPQPSGGSGESEADDPAERLRQASAVLRAARKKEEEGGGDEDDDGDEDVESDVPAKAKQKEESATEEPGGKAAFSVDAHRQKVLDVLKDLTPEQRDEVLGTSDEAFAAITAKRRRLHREREEHLEERGRLEAQRRAFDEEQKERKALNEEWDQALVKGKQNPHEALALFGWTLQQAFEFDSTGQVPADKATQELDSKYEKRIKELESRLERAAQDDERRQAEARERAATETWHGGVKRDVEGMDAGTYPLLKRVPKERVFQGVIALQTQAFNAHKARVQEAQRDGLPPPQFAPLAVSRALGYLEGELRTQQGWFSDPAQAGAVESAKTEAGKGPRTLSTTMVSEHGSGGDEEELSPKQRVRLALRALRGED